MCKARGERTCIVVLLTCWMTGFFFNKMQLGNMNQFSHFHYFNLKLLKYSSTRITYFYTIHQNSHEIFENRFHFGFEKLIFTEFDKKVGW